MRFDTQWLHALWPEFSNAFTGILGAMTGTIKPLSTGLPLVCAHTSLLRLRLVHGSLNSVVKQLQMVHGHGAGASSLRLVTACVEGHS